MNNQQMEVLRKIIYAVETGGQVYGRCDYGDFTEAYMNSTAEHAITIGAGQWYGEEARRLLLLIRDSGGKGFSEDLQRHLDYSWSHLQIRKESALAQNIVGVITTEIGKSCQDRLMDDQMREYCREAEDFGVTDARAQAMCANFRHQGGFSAMKRIISKADRPYTLQSLYNATLSDTGNQVGAYRSRQKFVYNALKKHMEDNTVQTAEEVREIRKKAANWMINLAEDNFHGYDQSWRWGERGDYDCSSAVITAYRHAGLDLEAATYTGNMKKVFLQAGFLDITPSVNLVNGSGMLLGDVLLNEVHHTAMYLGDGREVEASINEKGGARGGQPGDQTGREILIRPYRNYPWDCVLRYVGTAQTKFRPVLRAGDQGEIVKEAQKLLNENGANLEEDGEFGKLTLAAVMDFQTRHLLAIDGIIGEKTWYALDHQVMSIKKSPGIIRQSPRKNSHVIEKLSAGDKVKIYEFIYNERGQKWGKAEKGWIVGNNLQ